MSCPNATAPIDVSISKITGKCDFKCSYNFHYNDSSCIATNRHDYISIAYDKSSSPVTYNAVGYNVQEIRLYIPSLHSYNDSKTDGELIIVHTSVTGAKPLLVCIPIQVNNTSSVSALFFKTLVDTVASNAPVDGETTTVNMSTFNLDLLVPRKPFFSYSATEPYQPCSTLTDYVVFSPLQSSLDMMQDTFVKLKSIIVSNSYDIKTGPNLFYNEKGPSNGNLSGDIYIDCQPVGASDNSIDIISNTNNSYSFNFNDWIKNTNVQILLGSLIFILLLYVIKYALNLFNPNKPSFKIPKLFK